MDDPFTRLGFHYFSDDSHYTEQDLERWLPILSSHSAQWLVLRATGDQLIPEFFLNGLLEAEIRPLIWIHSPIAKTRAKDLASAFNSYKSSGVESVIVFDRPNMRSSWPAGEWSRSGLVERFVDCLLPILQIQRAVGLAPIFPPLEPGGDYWDTAFLQSAVQFMMRRGHHDLLREMRIAMYAWAYGKPLSWGTGGPERWTESVPYHTPEGSEDQLGMGIFDWYASILTGTLGVPLPMFAVSGGAMRGDPLDPPSYAEQTQALLRALASDQIAKEVFAFAFYPFVAPAIDSDDAYAWYEASGEARPVALSTQRAFKGQIKSPTVQDPRPIDHYMLVASDTPEMAHVGLLAHADQAVIGFSSDQARLAKRVTLVGPVPASIERRLRKGGAEVSRYQRPADGRRSKIGEGITHQAQVESC